MTIQESIGYNIFTWDSPVRCGFCHCFCNSQCYADITYLLIYRSPFFFPDSLPVKADAYLHPSSPAENVLTPWSMSGTYILSDTRHRPILSQFLPQIKFLFHVTRFLLSAFPHRFRKRHPRNSSGPCLVCYRPCGRQFVKKISCKKNCICYNADRTN